MAQFIYTQPTTIGFWEVKEGAVLPMNSNFQEQIK